MADTPLLKAWRRARRNEARALGLWGRVGRLAPPLVAAALFVPVFRGVFLSFLDQPAERWGQGAEAVSLRVAAVVLGWLAIDLYGALVRGGERRVLALLPVDPAEVVRLEIVRVAFARWWMLPVAAAWFAPIALAGDVALWLGVVAVVAGGFALGLTAGAAVHLAATLAAEDERLAPLLDLGRGQNVRAQAAFLYAPGFALLAGGALLAVAAGGARVLATGDPRGLAYLAVPFVGAGLLALPLPALGRSAWFRASAVLADIDARYATLADRDEASRVYLDWAVRFLPPRVRPWALADLRHGWRARRVWVTGAWLAGLAGFVAGWTADPSGPVRAAAVSFIGLAVANAASLALDADEPAFLAAWLAPSPRVRGAARLGVLWAWAQPLVVLPAFAVAVRAGASHGLALAGLAELVALLAAGLAVLAPRLLARGSAAYLPASSLLAVVAVAAYALLMEAS